MDSSSPLLRFSTDDLDLIVSCKAYDALWEKARKCMRCDDSNEPLQSTYSWDDESSVLLVNGEVVPMGVKAPSVFFENSDYHFWISFKKGVTDAYIDSPLKIVSDCFEFNEGAEVLFGTLNFGNDIGRSDLKIAYKLKGGSKRHCTFRFDVLSVKIDYHKDLQEIITDIEQEYRMLTIDFFRRTYHQFREDANGSTPAVIWWQVFGDIEEDFLNAAKTIIDRPHNRLHQHVEYLRADRLKLLSPQLEEELAEHRQEDAHIYRTEVPELNVDTFENRFLKFAVRSVQQKYEELSKKVKADYAKQASDKFIDHINDMNEELKRLSFHPFFRMVGTFKGMTQENLVLKQATGYSQIYHDWILLSTSYSFEDGIRSLQLKNIAQLYEIWCFIEVKNIVKDIIYGKMSPQEEQQHMAEGLIDNNSRTELANHFVYDLSQGKNSKVIFSQKDDEGNLYELAEVIYNPEQGKTDNDRNPNIENAVSVTVKQKPDIVLRLDRKDMNEKFLLTYLFDAKYRIDYVGEGEHAYDTPPEDAINQMHRYRDAIYYEDPKHHSTGLKKEVIGGYILFPGNGQREDIEARAGFYKSISKVNIGAFPLRSGNMESRSLLIEFIEELIDRKNTIQVLQEVIPQKGTSLSVGEDGEVLAVKVDKNSQAYARFKNGFRDVLYYFGNLSNEEAAEVRNINFRKFSFFVPVFSDHFSHYVANIYIIESATISSRKDIARMLDDPDVDKYSDADIRPMLKLSHCMSLYGQQGMMRLKEGIIKPFRWGFHDFKSIGKLMDATEQAPDEDPS